jgi:hypothetical protein
MPDISYMTGKGDIKNGVMSFATGGNFSSYNFKEGKTNTMDMTSIFKSEKGADALKKLQAGLVTASGKAKVTGGPTNKKSKSKTKKGSTGTRQLV